MAQAVSRRPVIVVARDWGRSRAGSCGFCGARSGAETGFPRVRR